MIKRRNVQGLSNQDNLRQSSIVSVAGINETSPPTSTNNVKFIKNLQLNTDGSLSLRKPLILKNSLDFEGYDVLVVKYLYDKEHKIVFLRDSEDLLYFTIIDKNNVYSSEDVYKTFLSWTDIHGKVQEFEISNGINPCPFFKVEDLSFINTSTTTVIGNCKVDLTNSVFKIYDAVLPELLISEIYSEKLYDAPAEASIITNAYRYLQVLFEETSKRWLIKIMSPEVNAIDKGSLISLNPNTTVDNAYSIRDNYNASIPSIKNILAYTTVVEHDGKLTYSPEAIDEETFISSEDASFFGVLQGSNYVERANIPTDLVIYIDSTKAGGVGEYSEIPSTFIINKTLIYPGIPASEFPNMLKDLYLKVETISGLYKKTNTTSGIILEQFNIEVINGSPGSNKVPVFYKIIPNAYNEGTPVFTIESFVNLNVNAEMFKLALESPSNGTGYVEIVDGQRIDEYYSDCTLTLRVFVTLKNGMVFTDLKSF